MEEAVLLSHDPGIFKDAVYRICDRYEYEHVDPVHQNAFRYFGGYPEEILYDNMKQVVIKRLLKQEDSTLNRQFEDFAGFYGFKPILCRPYRGQTSLERLSSTRKAQKERSSGVMEENRRLREKESSLELELAVRRQLQQYQIQRLGKTDFSGVQNLPEYQVIEQLRQKQGWSVKKLCEAVGVSRAAYYKWRNRTESPKQSGDEELAILITEIYNKQHGIPGYRQMKLILERRHGIKCNLKRVYRLMRVLGLQSICRKKKHRRKKKVPASYISENVLNREFTACRQNEKWLTDVTEFKYGNGRKAYLSAILDLYGRNIVSFSLSQKNDTALVLDTFEQAFLQCSDSKPLVHSDRGVQYTSRAFRKRLEREQICQSMSRPGKCLDNAPMEGFWGILKSEMYHLHHFDEYRQLCHAITAYINFYNTERFQKRLGGMTPMEFLMAGGK